MATRIKDRDRGWKKHGRVVKRAARTNPHVLVGVQGPGAVQRHKGSPLTSVEVAAVHEFGAGDIPERSFIRATFDKNEREYAQILNRFQKFILLGTLSTKKALGILGLKVQSDTLAHMRAGIDPDKADGDTARLKDTGQLYGDITFEVSA